MLTTDILQQANSMKKWLINIRRDFHQYPELGMEEIRTKEKIVEYLTEMGIETITDIANTAVVGVIKGEKPGKTVALRADMDALPIDDRKEEAYSSKISGKMHACGHDAHMSILLGAAKILKGLEKKIAGTVKLFFQPAEETVGGAKLMIKEGVMENPKVDVVFGLHISPEIPVGSIGIKYGQMNASSDTIKIIIEGVSSHGAYPHGGVDAIAVAAQVITALQTIVSRNIDPRDSAVITLGTICGGTQGNILANRVEMVGTVRTLDSIVRDKVLHRIKKITQQVAEGFDASGKVILEEGYPPLINDDKITKIVEENAKALLGDKNVIILKSPSLGVEDFAYFLEKAPGTFFRLGSRNESKGIIHEGHSNLFDIDEDSLPIGVALQVMNVIRILGDEKKNV